VEAADGLAGLFARPQRPRESSVLGERLAPVSARRVQAHQGPVGHFVGGRLGQHPPQRLHGRIGLSPLLVQRGEIHQQRQVCLAQGVPTLVRPLLVAVGGQQLPRVEFDGGPVGGGVARAAGGGSLELLGVHPQGFFGAQ
jgi:hypothetical protein